MMRGIQSNLKALLRDLSEAELSSATRNPTASLGDDHDGIDMSVTQATSRLEDLNKDINDFFLRCREWYSRHFPELSEIVSDRLAYIKIIKNIGIISFSPTLTKL